MKKTYVYFLVPLLGLIVFGTIYWNFLSTYEAKEEAKHKIEIAKRDEKLRVEAANREKAINDALAAQDKRKKERELKEAKDRADHDARDVAIETRRKAFNDKEKFTRQVDRLKADVRVETDALAKLDTNKKNLLEEEAFLKTYVKQVEANDKKLAEVIQKIADADQAAAERAKAEAAAAKAKNS